jgi:hypothetical protein
MAPHLWTYVIGLIATIVLAIIPGNSFAQIAPVRAWPQRQAWIATSRDADGVPVCTISATDNDLDPVARTLEFVMFETKTKRGLYIGSRKQAHEIRAPAIRFSSDGFFVLEVLTQSKFSRLATGPMANFAVTELDGPQWTNVWRLFKTSGTVLASTAFVDASLITAGFAEAEEDFKACLLQLDLVAGQGNGQ